MEWETFCNWVETVIRDNPQKDILVVLNTIRSARELYQYCSNLEITHRLEYLSSHVVPKDRLKRIKSIAHRKSSNPTLVISTQWLKPEWTLILTS
jgi:CRISPR-associated endonuclease/helicase Cas3